MAGSAKKTEHVGQKKGRGAYWWRNADAKRESNKVRRLNAKRAVRQGSVEATGAHEVCCRHESEKFSALGSQDVRWGAARMRMFKSESDLVVTIEKHDVLVRQCVNGVLGFLEFCEEYKDFYAYYALDGHESDAEERLLLEKYDNRIEPHRVIAHEILGLVRSGEDAKLDSYKQAGRFGPDEALLRLKRVKFSN